MHQPAAWAATVRDRPPPMGTVQYPRAPSCKQHGLVAALAIGCQQANKLECLPDLKS